ncbi:MAG: fibrobacter succinogenes major paralogous domain-containing protein [Bacteroidales bacterium]
MGINKFLIYQVIAGFLLFINTSCKKDEIISSMVTDIDGNKYNTVIIGSQIWMKENLKTTRYNDGTPITYITDSIEWITAGEAYCWYANDSATYKAAYGALYNWYAVAPAGNGNRNICPTGWHIPTDSEWETLTIYLGGSNIAGGKLKEEGTANWISPNAGADNSSGFTALPGGNRYFVDGAFVGIGTTCYLWSSVDYDIKSAANWGLYYGDSIAYRLYSRKSCGYSVRCLKN